MAIILSILLKTAIYILFIISLNNLILGKTNYWPIGHLSLFAFSAFFIGFLQKTLLCTGYLIYIGIIITIFLAGTFSITNAYIIRRVKGEYYIFYSICLLILINMITKEITGSSGYSGILRPPGLQSDPIFLLVIILTILAMMILIIMFNRHHLNKLHAIIRYDELLAVSMGINITYHRIYIFFISGVIAGLAGVFFAFYLAGTDYNRFSIEEAIIVFALCLFGGVDSIRGTIIAAITYTFTFFIFDSLLYNVFEQAPHISQLLFGFLLIVVILRNSRGLMGTREI